MSANLTSNNKYWNLSANTLNLNGLDVQTEIDNLKNLADNAWDNTNSGSVETSTGLVLTTDGVVNGAIANGSLSTTYDDQTNITKFIVANPEAPNQLELGIDKIGNASISNNSQSININGTYFNTGNDFSINPFNNNLVVNGNVILDEGYGIAFNNLVDTNNMKIYHDSPSNGDFIFNNGVGSKEQHTGSSGYWFDNQIYMNGVPIGGGNAQLLPYLEALQVPSAGTFNVPPCVINSSQNFLCRGDVISSSNAQAYSLNTLASQMAQVIEVIKNMTGIQIS